METTIRIETLHCNSFKTTIAIDNSTEFKDFLIQTEKKEPLALQLHKGLDGKGVTTLEIGQHTLIGREIELLKEFLNQ